GGRGEVEWAMGPGRQRDAEVLDREERFAHRSRSLGLSASLRPSPTRLIARTVSRIATPGTVTSHQASRRKARPAPIWKPQLIRSGAPRPRNESADSMRIALAT